jgi:tetratricopeptide (TPR) repeat protein
VDDTFAILLATEELIRDYKTILVYSWGASTFSVSFYERTNNGFQILSHEGTMDLGGSNIDIVILKKLLQEIQNTAPEFFTPDDPTSLLRIVKEAQKVKLSIAGGSDGFVRLQDIYGDITLSQKKPQVIMVSHDLYIKSLNDMIENTLVLVKKVLAINQIICPDIVLLSGKMSQLPQTQHALKNILGIDFIHVPETAVANGSVLFGKRLPEYEWKKAERIKTKLIISNNNRISSEIDAKESSPIIREQEQCKNAWSVNFIPLLDEAQQHYEQNHFEQAIDTFDKLFHELIKFSGELYRAAAQEYERTGNLDKALQILSKAHQQDSSNIFVAVDLAKICYRFAADEQGKSPRNIENTIAILEQGIKVIESLPDREKNYSKTLAELLHLKACVLCSKGGHDNLIEAEKLVSKSILLDSKQRKYSEDLEKIATALKNKNTGLLNWLTDKSIKRVYRNEPCPCGSGKKYKKCHGSIGARGH